MARPAPFPHRYTVTLADGRLVAPPRAPIALGPPPQFGGTDDTWSPEDLLVGAVLECFWTTFLAFARRDKLEVLAWCGTATGVLDRGHPIPIFTSIDLAIDLSVAPPDVERARQLAETAERNCIVSNALKVPITLATTVRPVEETETAESSALDHALPQPHTAGVL